MSADDAAAEPRPGTESYWSDLAAQAERESEQGAARHYGMKAEEYAAERWDLIEHETGYSDILIPYDHPTPRPSSVSDSSRPATLTTP
jgi:hypothetical protein